MVNTMNIKKIVVIGAGIMGSGIAQVAAQNNINVHIIDNNNKSLVMSKSKITLSLSRLVKKEIISQEKSNDVLSNKIKWNTSIKEVFLNNNIKFIIEAVPEIEEIKKNIIEEVNKVIGCDKKVIFATNTSSISITKLASIYKHPNNFIGMHFMNPVPIMKLVEIIPGLQTDTETIKIVEDMSSIMKKDTTISIDRAGFIANRIFMPMINEAFFVLMEKIGSPEDIDKTMKLGFNHPMGPLGLADFIGLDTCLHVLNVLYTELGEDKYRPCPLLKQYVNAGWYGRKSKRGVYIYNK